MEMTLVVVSVVDIVVEFVAYVVADTVLIVELTVADNSVVVDTMVEAYNFDYNALGMNYPPSYYYLNGWLVLFSVVFLGELLNFRLISSSS